MRTSTPTTLQTSEIEYEHDGIRLKGFLAFDTDAVALNGKRPGVLVCSEWWGLNDHAWSRARRLAELGYVAFAADVYGEGQVIDLARPEDAAQMAASLRANPAVWRGRAQAALDQLAGRPEVDATNVAAIGHCLDTAVQLAYAGAALKAVVTFHSILPVSSDTEASAVRADLLVCVGGDDPFIPAAAVAAFQAPLVAAGVAVEVVTYPGVAHSFTSPAADRVGRPDLRYDLSADEDSWRRMREFLAEAFGESKSARSRDA